MSVRFENIDETISYLHYDDNLENKICFTFRHSKQDWIELGDMKHIYIEKLTNFRNNVDDDFQFDYHYVLRDGIFYCDDDDFGDISFSYEENKNEVIKLFDYLLLSATLHDT